MADKYYSIDDKIRRLDGTICMYDGKPCHVRAKSTRSNIPLGDDEVLIGRGDVSKLDHYYLKGFEKVKYTDDNFSYDAFPLGYVNYGGNAIYVAREPQQQYAQGLSYGALVCDSNSHKLSSMYLSQDMFNCIEGIYPTFNESIKALNTDADSKAFDRNFAIKRISKGLVVIEFAGSTIGVYSTIRNLFKVTPGGRARLLTRELTALGVPHVIEDL